MERSYKIVLIGISIFLFVFGILPFLVPVPPLEDVRPVRDLVDDDSRFVTVNDLDVHYKRSGEGEPTLVLLHGFGASLYSWREVTEPLSEMGTVIAYDRPAFGLTERPLEWEGANPYSTSAQVELVRALLDEFQIQQAVLIGNSAGGTIAVSFALRYPERTAGLVLVDAAIYTGGGSPPWIRPFLKTPQMDHLGPLFARMIEKRGELFLQTAWHDPETIPAETYQLYKKPLRVENWDRALWELTRASQPLDLPAQLKDILVPTLVVTGDDDRVVPTEESLQLADDLPDAQLVVFENCGHVPQEECPQAFLTAVEEYLNSLR